MVLTRGYSERILPSKPVQRVLGMDSQVDLQAAPESTADGNLRSLPSHPIA